jgi:proteasome lid subunit RPN8/RPN11
MTPMPESILAAIRAHAQAQAPRECCGVVIVRQGKLRYLPCANLAASPEEHFVLSPADFARAEDQGEIVRIVHSHPYTAPEPSQADRVGCEASGLPWLIVNWPIGTVHEFAPSGYVAPLIGRSFHHGVLDCYSLIRDYYRQTLHIDLPDFHRDVQWWLRGGDLYREGFPQAGFVEVPFDTLAEHDVLLMQIGSPVINHAAVHLGDNLIVQHCAGRLSSRDVFGGAWRRATRKVIRHKDLL